MDSFVSTSKSTVTDPAKTPKYKSKRLDAAVSKMVNATTVSSVNIFNTTAAPTTKKRARKAGPSDKKKKPKGDK